MYEELELLEKQGVNISQAKSKMAEKFAEKFANKLWDIKMNSIGDQKAQ